MRRRGEGVRTRLAAATAVAALAGALAGAGLTAGTAQAEEAAAPPGPAQALGELSIEELSQVNVTSVSKRPEPLGHAAASIYLITNEALLRSGAMSLPEALRLAPNVEVLRIDALDYSISSRGFAGFESSNKQLVLVDGRSVYTPLFSGVDWDQHHLVMEDIERIEVISGPGGTLWGANAVNGVINVVSKSAFDTDGLLAAANLGTLDSDVRLRAGRPLGDIAAGRVYVTAFRRGDLETADGADANDGWDGWQAGFRVDVAGDRDTFTLQGDVQDADIPESLGFASGYARGGNLVARWTRRTAGGTQLELQGYYDVMEREARQAHDEQRVWDAALQVSRPIGTRHQLVAGGGYRVTKDEFRTLLEPQLLATPRRTTEIGNLFVEDEIALTPELLLAVGVKLETNSYTKAEWMPSARLGWRVSERQFLWASVSRAVRNPSRIERDFTIEGLVRPGVMGSEKLIAYEGGWRGRLTPRATASITLFYHDYDDIRTNELTPPGTLPIVVGNGIEGETWGVEAWADVQVTDRWRLSVGGVRLEKQFRIKDGVIDLSGFEAAGADPAWWLKANSHIDLTDRLSLDVGVRAFDAIPRLAPADYVGADGYVEAQARLAFKVREDLELSLTGLNLLHARHAEASEARRNEIPRSVHVGLRWMR
ncbi:TonB-dependent receptor [Phenylobacterium zucineum HLK1]|uniref:TonB-dependent receptor n=1 Tax=Phenylobacterium zucineum (strain HLK1) TaxID=450851 RepID=B4RHI8_PHEZH|nr:TonB-dependent receptor [Phenylobacterium zucineum]ACG77448.1 TonB-dependent receptor [Phenylobacterium zucineum HLK1]